MPIEKEHSFNHHIVEVDKSLVIKLRDTKDTVTWLVLRAINT